MKEINILSSSISEKYLNIITVVWLNPSAIYPIKLKEEKKLEVIEYLYTILNKV